MACFQPPFMSVSLPLHVGSKVASSVPCVHVAFTVTDKPPRSVTQGSTSDSGALTSSCRTTSSGSGSTTRYLPAGGWGQEELHPLCAFIRS